VRNGVVILTGKKGSVRNRVAASKKNSGIAREQHTDMKRSREQ
jgi:hypothetical protein